MDPEGSRSLSLARSGCERTASPIHEGPTTRTRGTAQWPAGAPPTSLYSVPQYGQRDSPVFSMGMYTRGCVFQSFCEGSGQWSGRSAAVISTLLRSSSDGSDILRLHGREPMVVLAVAAVDDVEERRLDLLGDRPARSAADRAAVELADRRDFRRGAREERFVGDVDVVAREARLLARDAEIRADRLHAAPRDSVQRRRELGRVHAAVLD